METMTSDRHFEARVKTPSGGRHRMVIKAADTDAARKEMFRWANENDKKIHRFTLWEVLAIPGTTGT